MMTYEIGSPLTIVQVNSNSYPNFRMIKIKMKLLIFVIFNVFFKYLDN